MREIKDHSEFTYWKRPWQKWLVLAVAILQCLCLWMHIQEYNSILSAGVLSAAEWADYAAQKNWQCAINGVLVVCFFGTFLIGGFARNQRQARLLQDLLLLLLALGWGAAGLALHLSLRSAKGLFWLLILLMALGGAVYDFLRYRRE